MAKHECIRYRGIKFYRYPDSPHPSLRRYWGPGIRDRQRGIDSLHREIWRDANNRQEIPEGFHVHHIDGDYDNNSPDNLELISGDDHMALHAAERRQCPVFREVARRNMRKAMEAAREWHGTDEGLRWHSENGKAIWKNRKYSTMICEQCGADYETRSNHGEERFCSNRCRSAWRRASGLDDVDRICAHCGSTFRINKYAKTKCCSRSCAAFLRAASCGA